MDGWDNYFVAQAGAAAAFAGLVLVSVSINLDKIIKGPGLVGRSAELLIVLFTLLTTASFMHSQASPRSARDLPYSPSPAA